MVLIIANYTTQEHPCKKFMKNSGFTLIELLIAIVVGSTISLMGVTVYSQASVTKNVVQAELQIQESAYYIHQILKRYINQAGYVPLSISSSSFPILPIDTRDSVFTKVDSITDTDGNTSRAWGKGEYFISESEGFALRFMGASNYAGVADGTMVDCQGLAVGEGTVDTLVFAVQNNSLTCVSGGNSVEFIGVQDDVRVEDIVVDLGIDTNDDMSADEYRGSGSALSSGENVVSARIFILLASLLEVEDDATSYTYKGVSYTSADKRIRRQYISTVQLK